MKIRVDGFKPLSVDTIKFRSRFNIASRLFDARLICGAQYALGYAEFRIVYVSVVKRCDVSGGHGATSRCSSKPRLLCVGREKGAGNRADLAFPINDVTHQFSALIHQHLGILMWLNTHMRHDTLTVDLTTILDDPRWRASEELQTLLRKPLARRLGIQDCVAGIANEPTEAVAKQSERDVAAQGHGNLVVLNDWLAERSRRNFGSEQQSC